MAETLLWRRPDGGISLTVVDWGDRAEALAHADQLLTLAPYAGWELVGICDETELPDGGRPDVIPSAKRRPAAREYRNAWDIVDGKPIVEMGRAREIHRQRLRLLRAPMLSDLDVAYQRADERGDAKEKRAIAARKQLLRDATSHPSIEAASSVEELARAIPEVLLDATISPTP